MQNESNLVWIDMEMTGLRPEKDRILEIAKERTANAAGTEYLPEHIHK